MRTITSAIVCRSCVCLLAAALAACGGGGGGDGEPTAAATAADATVRVGPTSVIPPLLDNDGSVAPAAAGTEPADPGTDIRTTWRKS